jgi:hypothetical protein
MDADWIRGEGAVVQAVPASEHRLRRPRRKLAVIALATGFAALCVLLVGVVATNAANHAGSSARWVATMPGPELRAVPPVVLQSLDPGAVHPQPVSLAAVPPVLVLFAVACSWLTCQRGQLSVRKRIAVSRPGRSPPHPHR